MKPFYLIFLLVFISCKKDGDIIKISKCSTAATVRDLTGLDGCGFVFELEDGTRLEPLRIGYCGTPPLPKEITNDPLYNFVFVNGKKVKIGYERLESPSICMVGQVVKITCLEEVKTTTE
jgi:hypothetical protein